MSYGIQRGIIEQVITPYTYKVRLVNYDSDISDPNKTKTSDLPTATVMTFPGVNIVYNINDRVIVGFNKDELNEPVILGSFSTPNYSTDENQFSAVALDSAVEKIIEDINKYVDDSSTLYTHVKYSNDNGLTLTSLYEYTDIESLLVGQVKYRMGRDIVIDPNSTVIFWSVIDENNVDVTSQFIIETILRAGETVGDQFIVSESESFTEPTINIPLRVNNFPELRLDFNIVDKSNFDDYHIVLTTDKNSIGSVYGDYMGICISTDPEAPDTPSKYTWTSFNKSIKATSEVLETDLKPRIRRNEEALYGHTYDTDNAVSDGTGLLDGITISNRQIDIHGVENRDVVLNINKSVFVDNANDNFTVKDLRFTKPLATTSFSDVYENGHLMLTLRNNQ